MITTCRLPPVVTLSNFAFCNEFYLCISFSRAPRQMLRRHRSLEADCATLWRRWLYFFSIFLVNEHRWNESVRGNRSTCGKTRASATLSTTNPTWTIYVLLVILKINVDSLPTQQQPIILYKGETLCFIWFRNLIFKYNLHSFQPLNVKVYPLGLCIRNCNLKSKIKTTKSALLKYATNPPPNLNLGIWLWIISFGFRSLLFQQNKMESIK
jgi:hypothetical protein